VRLQFDDLTFDSDTRQLWTGKGEARLSPKAFDLLALLITNRPRAVSKTEIRDHLCRVNDEVEGWMDGNYWPTAAA
jgi:DNA-binding response OmpR family regulator